MTSLGASILASSAFAADVSIKGSASEGLEASNNYFLTSSPAGATIKSLTAGTLAILAQTPTTNYLVDTNYSYYKYFGPGAADQSPNWGTPANARFSIDHTEQTTKYNAAVSWTRADAATTNLAQTGVAAGRGSINSYTAIGGITHDFNRNDSVTWTTQASKVIFTDPLQFPSVDVASTLAWQRTISSTTTLSNFVSFDWFSQDNPAQSQRLFWKLMTGLDSKLSPRLSLTGHVGIGFVNSYQTAQSSPLSVSNPGAITDLSSFGFVAPFQPQVGTGNSILGDIALTYLLSRATTVSLIAAQAIVPTTFGALQKSDSVGLTLIHNINQRSNLSLSGQFSFVPATPGGNSVFGGQSGESEFLSASINYGYSLTREWRTNLILYVSSAER